MRKMLPITLIVLLFSFFANASDTLVLPKKLDQQTALKMREHYDGWFRNHKNTDGLIIEADRLAQLAQKFSGKRLGLIYGRRLEKEKDHGHRITIILVVYGGTTTSTSAASTSSTTTSRTSVTMAGQNEYYDLGDMALVKLCPPPTLCDLEQSDH